MDLMRNTHIKVLYRKNLKMTPGKLAAQVAHCVARLLIFEDAEPLTIIVLEASDRKFNQAVDALDGGQNNWFLFRDAGRTEVEPETETVVAWEYERDGSK